MAFSADVEGWLRVGLASQPHFDRTRDALTAPADGEDVFFLAPVNATNGPPPRGKYFECFYAVRKEPEALPRLAKRFPHPKNNCQSLVLVTGSVGFTHGTCLVFFPENVAARDKVVEQSYAMFFYNKMRKIHETYAVTAARAVVTADSLPLSSSGLTADVCFEARAIWGYLHDSMHYQGPWPFDEHITLKMNWFVGLLEELKVDAKTLLLCVDSADVPFAREQIDMILLERIFRYPLADDATKNFDSGTGVFLYSWLRERGALADSPGGGLLRLHPVTAVDALRHYVDAVEKVERDVTTAEDYRAAAVKMVRRLLPEGLAKERFGFTKDQLTLRRAKAELDRLPPLTFGRAEW